MKTILLFALALGGGIYAFFSPPTALFLALVFAVALAVPNSVATMSPGDDLYGRETGHLPSSRLATLYVLIAFLMSGLAWLTSMWRRGEELTNWLTAKFLTAMRGFTAFALMVWAALMSWTTGSSGHRHSTGALPA